MNQLLPGEDEEISRTLRREMEKNGITVFTETVLTRVDKKEKEANVILNVEGKEIQQNFEKILMATGRKPNIDKLELSRAGIEIEEDFIKINKSFQTTNHFVYAAGDVIKTLMLAHVAYRERILAALACMGKEIKIDYLENNPRITYSFPQVASIGCTEKKRYAEWGRCKSYKEFF